MISVLVVDDSVVVRRLIVDALSGLPDIRVVGTAANGRIALAKVDQLTPDVVTMDIEMPDMDGITAVRALRKVHRTLPVIMFSTLSSAGAAATLDALAAGATDYVTKPANVGSVAASIQAVREQLVPRMRALTGHGRTAPPSRTRPAAAPPPTRPAPHAASRPIARTAPPRTTIDVIAIGASTGGPDALARVIGAFPADLPVPVVVVQHMPPVFTRMFAERLNRMAAVRVVEAEDDMPVTPGVVYIAPGDRHLEVLQRGTARLTRLTGAPPENSCRPAVDVLFRSVDRVYGASALAVVLTGMGHDGRRGCEVLHAAGAEVIAQDEASSVVWGMPGAVVEAGLAHTVLPLAEIGTYLNTRMTAGRQARPKVVTR
ncbi:two-component system, chemotaxis family, response regulator CheB [Micromonospora pattaloongensis]|uniref:Protein-glutamate methylesterase/protein-glutamine glutaminase n=1 Tax=Micromonospora pattaloongensis TaxID=405436 RepID=A0A1H3N054_9ACTN|nr:chemotaxis-specific protein-glutamate methyltransferase CheB [Micromonospora pattaloongensis]SDY82120.1 two-component system, chemotaxis family, response regulator CheB [Micromonospora pattaloongensis]